MIGYCPHLVPLTHSCENCSADKPLFETRIKNLETQLKHKEGINKSLEYLVLEQNKKIIDLATKLGYANQTIENLTVEPPKEKEPQYLYIYRDTSNNISVYHAMMVETFNNFYYMGKVRVEK